MHGLPGLLLPPAVPIPIIDLSRRAPHLPTSVPGHILFRQSNILFPRPGTPFPLVFTRRSLLTLQDFSSNVTVSTVLHRVLSFSIGGTYHIGLTCLCGRQWALGLSCHVVISMRIRARALPVLSWAASPASRTDLKVRDQRTEVEGGIPPG